MERNRKFFYFGWIIYFLILISWGFFVLINLFLETKDIFESEIVWILFILSIFILFSWMIFYFIFFYLKKSELNFPTDFDLNVLMKIFESQKQIIIVFNSKEQIIWCNSANFFKTFFHIREYFQTKLERIFSDEILNKIQENKNIKLEPIFFKSKINYETHQFLISKIDSNILILFENNELYQLKKFIQDKRNVAFLLHIDDVSFQKSQQNITEAKKTEISSSIELKINKFFANEKSLVIRIARGKYLISIDYRFLQNLKQKKFLFIEKWKKEINDEFGVSITFSSGIFEGSHKIFKTHEPKITFNDISLYNQYQKASLALNAATNKGGNQIIISKDDDNYVVFGQEDEFLEIPVNIKKQYFNFLENIKNYQDIIVIGHIQADFDVFGAALGIQKILNVQYPEKRVHITIVNPEKQTQKKIESILDKEKYFDIIHTNWKYYKNIKNKNKILWIVVDTNNYDLFDIKDLKTKKKLEEIMILDHHTHLRQKQKPKFKLINTEYSSASEIIVNFLMFLETQKLSFVLNKKLAKILLFGILMDTDNLQNNLGNQTITAVNFLIQKGVDLNLAIGEMNALKSEQSLLFKQLVVIEAEDNILILKAFNIEVDSKNAALLAEDYLKKHEVDVVFAVLYDEEKNIFISARSSSNFDVETICKEFKGGGDNKRAAAKVNGIAIDVVINKLKHLIKEQIS